MNKLKSIVMASILALTSAGASAELIATDWSVEGDEKAVLNTETGIEWLVLSETWNMSINQVTSQMGDGELFEGWRLPSRDEVEFLSNSILTEGGTSLWNATFPIATSQNYRKGLFINDDKETEGGALVMSSGTRGSGSAWSYSRSESLDYKGSAFGVFLVSDGGTTLSSINNPSLNINNANSPINNGSASVPLSSSVVLMALSLAGFGVSSRRKKK